jgi:ubiquitin carboxyl-terminal hydrolase 1
MQYSTTLEECLSQFTAMEYLQDASCRRCSFVSTIKSLSSEIEVLKHEPTHKREKAKKRERVVQLVALEKAKRKIEHRFKAGRIEEEDEHDRLPLLKSVSRMSSKQVMLAKPPKILCLHISRSAFLNTGAVYKNTCQILFPEYLDVSPFSTNGTLNTQPNLPISTPASTASVKGYYYRLMSVVVHYGSHSFGHFVAFKRRIFADQCQCFQCRTTKDTEDWKCQHAWYRISDSKVDECTLDDVLRANPYMLLYELVGQDDMVEEEVATSVTSTASSSAQAVAEEEEEINTTDYNYIPTEDAAKEALRIANSLLSGDSHVLLPPNPS